MSESAEVRSHIHIRDPAGKQGDQEIERDEAAHLSSGTKFRGLRCSRGTLCCIFVPKMHLRIELCIFEERTQFSQQKLLGNALQSTQCFSSLRSPSIRPRPDGPTSGYAYSSVPNLPPLPTIKKQLCTRWCGNQVHLPQSALHKSPVLLYVLWKNVNAAVKFASNMNSFRSSSTSRKTNRLAENPLGRTGKTRNETAR